MTVPVPVITAAKVVMEKNIAVRNSSAEIFQVLGNTYYCFYLIEAINDAFNQAITEYGTNISQIITDLTNNDTDLYTFTRNTIATSFLPNEWGSLKSFEICTKYFNSWPPTCFPMTSPSITVSKAVTAYLLPFCELVEAVSTFKSSIIGIPISTYGTWIKTQTSTIDTFLTEFPLVSSTTLFPSINSFSNFTNSMLALFPWDTENQYSLLFNTAYLGIYNNSLLN